MPTRPPNNTPLFKGQLCLAHSSMVKCPAFLAGNFEKKIRTADQNSRSSTIWSIASCVCLCCVVCCVALFVVLRCVIIDVLSVLDPSWVVLCGCVLCMYVRCVVVVVCVVLCCAVLCCVVLCCGRDTVLWLKHLCHLTLTLTLTNLTLTLTLKTS